MDKNPSDFLKDALTALSLRDIYGDCDKIMLSADRIQMKFNPSKPHITMAAVFYLTHRLKLGIGPRSQTEIAKAFECSVPSIKRVSQIIAVHLRKV